MRVDTTGRSIEDALDDVLDTLYDGGWLSPPASLVEPVETTPSSPVEPSSLVEPVETTTEGAP